MLGEFNYRRCAEIEEKIADLLEDYLSCSNSNNNTVLCIGDEDFIYIDDIDCISCGETYPVSSLVVDGEIDCDAIHEIAAKHSF